VPLGRIHAWPSCTVAHGPRAQYVRGPLLCGAWPSSASAMAHGGAARGGLTTLSYGGDLTGARETAGKAWRGSPACGRRCGMTQYRRRRRDAVSVDVGVGGFGHDGDGSDLATTASDRGSRDAARSGRWRERRGGECGCRAALSGRRRAVLTAHLTR
jgi:hypothetical protein